jgi:transcriptional regulator with GAF, ATPase, and Fis domain
MSSPRSAAREARLARVVVDLTDTLVSGYDVVDLMSMLAARAVDLLEVTATAVILVGPRGALSVAAASSESSRLLEVFAVDGESGPCVDCVRTGVAVSCPAVQDADVRRRWPEFSTRAVDAGFGAVHALPMCLRGDVVGVLTLLDDAPHVLADDDRRLGEALADAATIGLIHERTIRKATTAAEQLQGALTSRVVVEQAKGVLAQQGGITVEEAFAVMRRYARGRGLRVGAVCSEVIAGRLDLAALGAERSRGSARPGR